MARFWASSTGAVGVTTRITGCFLALLLYGFALLGVLGIAALIYASV